MAEATEGPVTKGTLEWHSIRKEFDFVQGDDMIESPLKKTWGGLVNQTFRIRDITNRVRYGPDAPKYCERIWISPRDVASIGGLASREMSARVVSDWDAVFPNVAALHTDRKIRSLWQHFGDGVPWEETDEFQHRVEVWMRRKSMNRSDAGAALLAYYQRYEVMYGEMRSSRQMKTRTQVRGRKSFREHGGVLVHVGPDGRLVHGGHGKRRFAIAHLLDLERIPAVLGLVHVDALGHLPHLRAELRDRP